MSVPTHNLYDFVHQVLENKFLIFYFYPFGHKEFSNIVCYQTKLEKLDSDRASQIYKLNDHYNIAFKIFPKKLVESEDIVEFNKVVLCHDQEPLNYNLYENYLNHDLTYSKYEIENTKNLRWIKPGNLQKKWVLLHSELNSAELETYISTGKFVGAYWWSHAMIARDWYRFAEYDKSFNNIRNIKKMFLIYAREKTGTRQYRQKFLEKLKVEDINNCQIGSFLNDNTSSASSATYSSYDCLHSGISIVLETIFDERIHLTEKTLRPIACGHPFIIANGPGSLQYLKKYGFKTFHPWINEDYDKELDSEKRLDSIVKEMKRLQNLNEQDRSEVLKQCNIISSYNKKLFFSKKFEKQIVDELEKNIRTANQQLINSVDINHLESKRLAQSDASGLKSYYIKKFATHLKKGGTLENYVPPDLD